MGRAKHSSEKGRGKLLSVPFSLLCFAFPILPFLSQTLRVQACTFKICCKFPANVQLVKELGDGGDLTGPREVGGRTSGDSGHDLVCQGCGALEAATRTRRAQS